MGLAIRMVMMERLRRRFDSLFTSLLDREGRCSKKEGYAVEWDDMPRYGMGRLVPGGDSFGGKGSHLVSV